MLACDDVHKRGGRKKNCFVKKCLSLFQSFSQAVYVVFGMQLAFLDGCFLVGAGRRPLRRCRGLCRIATAVVGSAELEPSSWGILCHTEDSVEWLQVLYMA